MAMALEACTCMYIWLHSMYHVIVLTYGMGILFVCLFVLLSLLLFYACALYAVAIALFPFLTFISFFSSLDILSP